jgi:hypothetical protein
MDSEKEFEEAEESEEEFDFGVASMALATEFVSKSIFDHEEKGDPTNYEDCADDFTPTYCFMARGAKVTS